MINLFLDIFVKMTWLNSLLNNIFLRLNLDLENRWINSLHFFFYELVKISLLITLIIFIISYIQSFFPPTKTKEILTKYTGIKGNILASLLGVISPFCSCSSIPLFIGMNKAGAPVGASFSFLISSPLVDMASLLFLVTIFGYKLAVAYVLVGMLLAVIGGVVIERLDLRNDLFLTRRQEAEALRKKNMQLREKNKDLLEIKKEPCPCSVDESVYSDHIKYSIEQTLSVIKKIWKYILISVALGSLIYNFAPKEIIQKFIGENNYFSVLIATLIGVPIYTDEMSAMIIGKAFFDKGVQIGTVLAFMMSAAALSLPSIMMLKSVMSTRLLSIFVGIVTFGIIIIGYLFNSLYFLF